MIGERSTTYEKYNRLFNDVGNIFSIVEVIDLYLSVVYSVIFYVVCIYGGV
jgi:hypothetical protein